MIQADFKRSSAAWALEFYIVTVPIRPFLQSLIGGAEEIRCTREAHVKSTCSSFAYQGVFGVGRLKGIIADKARFGSRGRRFLIFCILRISLGDFSTGHLLIH